MGAEAQEELGGNKMAKYKYTAIFSDGTMVVRRSDRDYVAAYRYTYLGKPEFRCDNPRIYISLAHGFSGTSPVKVSHRVHPNKYDPPEVNAVVRRAEPFVVLEQVLVTRELIGKGAR
jgi:hypothetical protein